VGNLEETLDAIKAAQAMGPRVVLVTSVQRPETEEGSIEMIAADGDDAYIVKTPHLPFKRNGSADVTTALFACHCPVTTDASFAHFCSSRSPRSNPQDAQRVYPAPEKSARSLSFLADFLIPTCAGNIFVTSSLLSFCEGALTNVSSDILATALEFEIKGYGTLRGCRFHTKLSRFPDLYSSVMVIPLNC